MHIFWLFEMLVTTPWYNSKSKETKMFVSHISNWWSFYNQSFRRQKPMKSKVMFLPYPLLVCSHLPKMTYPSDDFVAALLLVHGKSIITKWSTKCFLNLDSTLVKVAKLLFLTTIRKRTICVMFFGGALWQNLTKFIPIYQGYKFAQMPDTPSTDFSVKRCNSNS